MSAKSYLRSQRKQEASYVHHNRPMLWPSRHWSWELECLAHNRNGTCKLWHLMIFYWPSIRRLRIRFIRLKRNLTCLTPIDSLLCFGHSVCESLYQIRVNCALLRRRWVQDLSEQVTVSVCDANGGGHRNHRIIFISPQILWTLWAERRFEWFPWERRIRVFVEKGS